MKYTNVTRFGMVMLVDEKRERETEREKEKRGCPRCFAEPFIPFRTLHVSQELT